MNLTTNLLGFETPVQNSIQIFGVEIYYYAICIVLGLLLATCLATLLMNRRNVSRDAVLLCFIVAVPCAILGARLYSCVSEGLPIEDWFSLSSIRNGGLSIMGGILGGVIGMVILCLIKRWNILRLTDCIAPVFPLAQAIGRWGNYFNQEVYGGIVESETLQFFPVSVFIEDTGEWHYAFFFYESVINFVWFIVLFLIAWNMLKKPNGLITALFFAFYGVVRAVMEPLRDPNFQYGGGVEINSSLVASYVLIGLGVAMIVALLVVNKLREGKFFGSRKGCEEGYVVEKFVGCDKEELPLYNSVNFATHLKKKRIAEHTQMTEGGDRVTQ